MLRNTSYIPCLRLYIYIIFNKSLGTSNVGRSLLVFLLTPHAKLNACVSRFTSVVQWVGSQLATT